MISGQLALTIWMQAPAEAGVPPAVDGALRLSDPDELAAERLELNDTGGLTLLEETT